MAKNITSALRRFLADENGAFIVEFGIAFPILILLSFGLLEFSLVVFDYQRAAEATRVGVRFTIINPSIANTATILNGSIIRCTHTGANVECTGGSPHLYANERWALLLAQMQGIYPTLKPENLVVTYSGTDVGSPDESGGVLPLVTLELVGLRKKLMVGKLTQHVGLEYIEFPPFTTTVLGPGNYVNVAEQVGNGKTK